MTDDIRDLLAAWAIDAVDDDERALIDARLAEDPELRKEADELLAITADLADDGDVAPPPQLRSSILDAIADTPQLEPEIDAEPQVDTDLAPQQEPQVDTGEPPAPVIPLAGKRRKYIAPALLAAAVVIVALIASMTLSSDQPSRDELIAAVVDADDAIVVSLDNSLGGLVEVIISPSAGDTVLTGSGITVPPEDRTYELWLVRPDALVPESVGVFLPTPAGDLEVLFVDVEPGGAVFAVSDEPTGGSPTGAPTGEVLAISQPPTA